MSTIVEKFALAGVAAAMGSVSFADPSGTIGLQRTDTGENLIAPGTAFEESSAGVYSYSFTDPAPALTYTYWVRIVTPAGEKIYLNKTFVASASGLLPTYLSQAAAAALAAILPPLRGWSAATTAQQTAALVQATSDIDNGMVYQGRRYDPAQTLQFPRMAYEAGARVRIQGSIPLLVIPPALGDQVWDWDTTNSVAFVPQDVLTATLHQADSILSGIRDGRLDAQHDGVISQGNSGLSESYKADRMDPGINTGLCRRAWLLMQKYKIRAGRLL